MVSIALKRSAATLGVVAGLLAAAGPASAQLPPTASGYTPPIGTDKGSLAAAEQGVWGPIVYVGAAGLGKDMFDGGGLTARNLNDMKVRVVAGTQIGIED